MAMSKTLLSPIHPGEILCEEFIVPLGLSGNTLATALGITATRINEIIQEKCGITADTTLRLSRYFGSSAEFWLNLQQRYGLEYIRSGLWCTEADSSARGMSAENKGPETCIRAFFYVASYTENCSGSSI
jgi:antitoxin HigA-1